MDFPKNKTVIFFSPHPDDAVISAGALILHLAKNNKVLVYYLTNSPKGVDENLSLEEKIDVRQKEARNACKVLGTKAKFLNLDKPKLEVSEENIKLINKVITDNSPSLIVTFHFNEAHPTHQKTTKLVIKANQGKKIKILLGEAWSPIDKPTTYFFFDENKMKIKEKAFNQYRSQLKRTNWMKATKALNQYRAITAREVSGEFGSKFKPHEKYAEAFLEK